MAGANDTAATGQPERPRADQNPRNRADSGGEPMSRPQRAKRRSAAGPARLPATPENLARARQRFADGVAAYEAGRSEDAAAALDDVLAVLPTSADALCARGMVAATLDDRAATVRYLRDGLQRLGGLPDDSTAEAWNELGVSQRAIGELDDAEDTLRALVERLPDHGHGWHNLALVLSELERHDEAAAAARRASIALPDHPGVLALLGKELRAQGRLHSAVAILRRALAAAPDDTDVLSSLGNTLFYLGEIDEALEMFGRACELRPDVSTVWTNIGTMLYAALDIDAALAAHRKALAFDPTNSANRFRCSAALLQKGRLGEGWTEYEQRLDGDPPLRRWAGTPTWDGGPFDERTLLVYREQGIGDEIMFASCIPDLLDRAGESGSLIIETDPRVVDLFARSFPAATVRKQTKDCLATDDVPEPRAPDADLVVAMGSLGLHLRARIGDFPARARGYLVPSTPLALRWSERLAALGREPVVGISWRSMIRTAERRLEYSRLDEWGEILTVAGIQFVLLQYDDCEREVLDAERRFGVAIHRWRDLDLKNDFENIAALMSNLDLVIAPRNAVTMLAGAIGVPTLAVGNEGDWSECGTAQLPWFSSVECINRNVRDPWSLALAATADRVVRLARGENAVVPPFAPLDPVRGA
jgi:tetratricopeptide (TPR) repeat protein